MLEPAVNGTKNVIMAAAEAKVRRVVFTSSIGTVHMDPNRSPDVVVDESCWSDLEYCKNTKEQIMVEPAVNGTKNVIMAAVEAKVRRVVFTSSIGTVYMDGPQQEP
ncbi:hypothetical protein NC651_000519 [Populus alba x Populus x berolinensis]|nr:hypothetical protein NC651_000519 [Populus alba x Populus x berolinensis]